MSPAAGTDVDAGVEAARTVDLVEVGLSSGARLGFEGCQVTRTATGEVTADVVRDPFPATGTDLRTGGTAIDGAAAMTLVQVKRPDRRPDTAEIIPTVTREVADEGVADSVSAAGTDLGTTAQPATGIELRQTGSDGGYPVFTVVSTRLHGNERPRTSSLPPLTKPDIRFRSSVDNDIEIVGGRPDDTLIYDREIPTAGLRWRDLHSWWQATRKFSSENDARTDLYQRLLKSLPTKSPGQINLFKAYHTALPLSVDHPALLPEVWLHWDPKTVKERGPEALLRPRMGRARGWGA
ncbi:hypothetical protein [Streptomyces sp. NPDC002346]